jgi:radical SAM protein with 4Fe4S-binding SPASM domain
VRTEPFFCRAGVSIASILCDGTVTGCPNNPPALAVGNVRQTDFARLWDDSFGPFRDRSWMRRDQCAACGPFKDCRGGSIHLWADRDRLSEPCLAREARSEPFC